MAISTKLQEMFNGPLIPVTTIRAEVDLTPGELIRDMALQVKLELERIVPYAGYADVADLSVDDIHKYLKTLLWIRVCSVTQSDASSFKPYKRVRPYVAVPVLMYQLLICVGNAYDNDYAIQFYPAYSPEESDLLGVTELLAVSDILSRFESNGMKIVTGTPKDTNGELAFMALSHVEDVVTGYRKDAPVYGFFMSFFKQSQLSMLTGGLSRIVYGYESDYRVQLGNVFRSFNSGGGGYSE